MTLSIFIAKVLAVAYISIGIALLSGTMSFRKMIEEFEKSPVLMYMGGFIALVIGMILVQYHNIWDGSWRVLVTLVGWLVLLKGLILIIFPKSLSWFRNMVSNSTGIGVFCILLGLLFGYFGFVM